MAARRRVVICIMFCGECWGFLAGEFESGGFYGVYGVVLGMSLVGYTFSTGVKVGPGRAYGQCVDSKLCPGPCIVSMYTSKFRIRHIHCSESRMLPLTKDCCKWFTADPTWNGVIRFSGTCPRVRSREILVHPATTCAQSRNVRADQDLQACVS